MATSKDVLTCGAMKTAVTVYGKNWSKISSLLGYNPSYCKYMWMNKVEPEIKSEYKRSQAPEPSLEDVLKINKGPRRLSEEITQVDVKVAKRRKSFGGCDTPSLQPSSKKFDKSTRATVRNILQGVDSNCDKYKMLKGTCVKLVETIRSCEARTDVPNKFQYIQRCEKKLKVLLRQVLGLSKNLVLVKNRSEIPLRSLVTKMEYLTEEELRNVVELNYAKMMESYRK